MNALTLAVSDYGPDVHILAHQDRLIFLIGTAHISQESVDLVRKVIKQEEPDCVCLELDDRRYQALIHKERWHSFDIKNVIRKKQLSSLVINLLMASYQKRLGEKVGVMPGAELLAAADAAKENHIPISLCDRDVRITLRRAWKSTSPAKKCYLLTSLFATIFDDTEISEERLTELKKKDVLGDLLEELGATLPDLKRVLIDERDIFLAEKIKASSGKRLVAVVGAGHIEGVMRELQRDNEERLAEINSVPPASAIWRFAGWIIPTLIVGALIAIACFKGSVVAGANVFFWILAHSISAAGGAILAHAHPYATLGAFSAAPFTSLSPLIGAGHVTAFIQATQQPPKAREFETVGSDISTIKGWWANKLLRVILVFSLTTLGSALGTAIGAYRILSSLVG